MHPRMLTADHAEPYRALMLHGYAHAPDAFTSTPQERVAAPLSWWANRLADPAGLQAVLGVEDGALLVGSVALEFSASEKTRHKAHLIAMYVLPSYRSQGIGRALVDAAIGHARARDGLRMLTLTVTAGNLAAIALYQAAGFTVFGTEPLAVRAPQGYLDKVHMWRDLQATAPPWHVA
jgi:ribosomal protein S18 acetylase RimI-like enzyme